MVESINFVFDLTRPGFDPMTSRTEGKRSTYLVINVQSGLSEQLSLITISYVWASMQAAQM